MYLVSLHTIPGECHTPLTLPTSKPQGLCEVILGIMYNTVLRRDTEDTAADINPLSASITLVVHQSTDHCLLKTIEFL